MRLGVVGMLPSEPGDITEQHLAEIRKLGLTGVGMSVSAASPPASAPVWAQVRETFAGASMDIVQVGIGFRDCLFDPDDDIRRSLLAQIRRGTEIARTLGAHVALIRTGSLSQNGPYSPHRDNHRPDCWERLLDSLGQVAQAAEELDQTVVIETHVLTILNSPEANQKVIETIGSDRLRVVMDYVNHFQALHQVYDSTARLHHIFDLMGPISAIGHCKDIRVRDGFVVHFDEEIPGEGELDLATALQRWHEQHPDGYMMLEHLPNESYPLAAANVQAIIKERGIPLT